MQKTLGGDRISSGKKMKVDLHGYERSTHNLSKVVRTTMSAGTLVPFLDAVALPADTWDIELNCEIMTHPTIGPLLGSYKVDLHVFQAPYRLYNALLHNNMLGIGRDMSQAKLPQIEMTQSEIDMELVADLNTSQVNPSSLLAYLGIRGVGFVPAGEANQTRQFNAASILAYWEIYKNYYANKQEEIGAVIHTPIPDLETTIDNIKLDPAGDNTTLTTPPAAPITYEANTGLFIQVNYTGTAPIPSTIYVNTLERGWITLDQISDNWADIVATTELQGIYHGRLGTLTFTQWRYRNEYDSLQIPPVVTTFPLSNIDDMRYEILSNPSKVAPFLINTPDLEPYKWLYERTADDIAQVLSSQEGLALKTYQSDLFNNWLNTENVEAITQASSIDTTGGFFTIDQLLIGKQVYNLLNRINVSGGTYDDWLEVVYDHEAITRAESPIYHGGLIKELAFQEVVSNSESQSGQPLGTLAGKGTLTQKHKGGKMTIKVDEPSVLIGLISLTPRIDYSQGNEWYTSLKTLDDLHKPQFDQIGFQDLPTTQIAWWDSAWDGTKWTTKSAGKQPAWINYMTETNKLFGNFAIPNNEMFMVLNRRYDHTDDPIPTVKDLTTYIDPAKFNFIFAETALDAQNFWAQIAIGATVRRKMSAKIMPSI